MNFVAILGLSFDSGICIIDIINGECVQFSHYYCGKYKKPSKSQIRYNAKGEPYFISYGKRYYLSEFLRIKYR